MTGFNAIAAHNGWAIAALGVGIVFVGLTLLSLMISQLHRILTIWDDRGRYLSRLRRSEQMGKKESEIACIVIPPGVKESVRKYHMLVRRIGEPIALPQLLDYAERCGLDRPHSTLNDLIRSGVLIPDQAGFYLWSRNIAEE